MYVGKVVRYVPTPTPNHDDEKYFYWKEGEYNTNYTIKSISGSDSQMTFLLVNDKAKKGIKMIINIGGSGSIGKDTYRITKDYSVPLLLFEDFDYDNKRIKNHQLQSEDGDISFNFNSLTLKPQPNYDDIYPEPFYEYTTNVTADTLLYCKPDYFEMLGKVYTSCYDTVPDSHYTIIGSKTIITKYQGHLFEHDYYILYSSKLKKTISERVDMFNSYAAQLIKVDKPVDSNVRYGDIETIEDSITRYRYYDDFIDINFHISAHDGFIFTLKNLANKTIKLIWNEAVYVDLKGKTSRVFHSGIKYSEKEEDQIPSTIISGAFIEDVAFPVDCAKWERNGWNIDLMFPNKISNDVTYNIRLMLPIQIGETINEYIFTFKLTSQYQHIGNN